MGKVYCKYCGMAFANVMHLSMGKCVRHPDGIFKGRHVLYEGSEKAEYTCKHCGRRFPSLNFLTCGKCDRHPNGTFKGPHEAAL